MCALKLNGRKGPSRTGGLGNADFCRQWLAEDVKGQVGYVPATYLKIIRDVTCQEEESDTARKEGYGKKTDGTNIGGRYDRMEKEERRIQRQ